MLKLVSVPALTLFVPEDEAIAPCAAFELVGAVPPDVAADDGVAVTLLAAVAVPPSAVVTTTRTAWDPDEAAMPTNIADLVCFGNNVPRAWVCVEVPSTNS
jgi:hypothetical protein